MVYMMSTALHPRSFLPHPIVIMKLFSTFLLVSIWLSMNFPTTGRADTQPVVTQAHSFSNSIGIEFVLVPAGSFQMGAHENEDATSKEKPRHQVTISKPFYISKHEITQKQWENVMGHNPSVHVGPTRPVDRVSWNDVQIFLQRLNGREKTTTYKLPTEAQWEYAARAGSETSYCYGDDQQGKKLIQYGWFEANSNKQSQPIGELKPNDWGIHDMHGNVQEWVQDRFDRKYYSKSPATDPHGPEKGRKRVTRGGSWINPAYHCRSAARAYYSPDYVDNDIGLRIIKLLPEE